MSTSTAARLRRGLALLTLPLLALAVIAAQAPPTHAQSACPPASQLPIRGGRWLLAGMNVPWQAGGFGADFATVEETGQHSYSPAATEALFRELRAAGVNTARWWLFTDGRGAPEFDSTGNVTGLDSRFLPSLADAVQLAAAHDIVLIPTLWSFEAFSDPARVAASGGQPRGRFAGNHQRLVRDPAARQALFERALIPMLQYPVAGTSYTIGTHPAIVAWDIINEPEWAIRESGSVEHTISDPLSLVEMQRFVAETAGVIHRNSSQLVTVGSAALRWNTTRWGSHWWGDAALQPFDPQGQLDFYQPHFYPWMEQAWGAEHHPARLSWQAGGFDKPVVIGEFPARGLGDDFLEALDRGCYAGGWAWSYEGVDGSGGWADIRAAFASFSAPRQARLRIGGTGSPSSPTSSPTSTAGPVAPAPSSPGPATRIYTDRLAAGWHDWSWEARVEPGAVVAGQTGDAALRVTFTGRGGGLKLHRDLPLALRPEMALQLRVHGGAGGARLRVELRQGERIAVAPTLLQPAAGSWTSITLPIRDFTPLPALFTDLVIRDEGGALGPISFDQIEFRVPPAAAPPTPPTSTTTVPEAMAMPIYGDSLTAGWRDDGWGVQTDLTATTERLSGGQAIAARYTTGWGAVRLTRSVPLARAGLSTLRLALHGGAAGGQRVRVIVRPSTGPEQRLTTVSLAAGQWRRLELPLPTGLADIAALVLQEDANRLPPAFFIDDIALVAAAGYPGSAPTTPVPTTTPPTVTPPTVTPPPSATAPTATAAPSSSVLRILPLGDSITEGVNGGYRNRLWERLRADGRSIDFVGPRVDPWARIPDREHAGTPGFTVGNLLASIDGYLASYRPEVVLLMAGTNDLAWWHVEGPEATAARLGALLDRISSQAPTTRVIVASIPPMRGTAAPNGLSRATLASQYNAAVRQEVSRRAGEGLRVSFADVHATLSIADLYDDVHPNEAAHARIADVWYQALQASLR